MEVLLYLSICFSCVSLTIHSLCLTFAFLIMICLGVGLFGVVLFRTLYASCTWISVSLLRLGKFLVIISLNTFLTSSSLFFSSPSDTSIRQMLVCLLLLEKIIVNHFHLFEIFIFTVPVAQFPLFCL